MIRHLECVHQQVASNQHDPVHFSGVRLHKIIRVLKPNAKPFHVPLDRPLGILHQQVPMISPPPAPHGLGQLVDLAPTTTIAP